MTRLNSMLGGVIAVGMISVSGLAATHVGQPAYALPDYQSGYQAQNSVGFQSYYARFTVPNAPEDRQIGLIGVDLHDLNSGQEAACGWLDPLGNNGNIGCWDAWDTSTGWISLLHDIVPGDIVAVSMRYEQNGNMKVKATDVTSRATSGYDFQGPARETWNEAIIGAIPSTTPPVRQQELSSFSRVSLTPVGGTGSALARGPWTLQPVIDTTNGESTGQVVASPTCIRHDGFTVLQRP